MHHIDGRWRVHQENNYHPIFEITCEHGGRLSGTASMDSEEGPRAGYHGAVSQQFQGRLENDCDIEIIVRWPAMRNGAHSVGKYWGVVRGNRMEGHCHDETYPNNPTYRWHAERI